MSLCLSTSAVCSRYALLLYWAHWNPLMIHGGINRRRTCIDILDDDSLLFIFYLCRPVPFEEGNNDHDGVMEEERWEGESYWWYMLAWVCRRWRHLILVAPSYLGVSLVCRPGTPVADMLAYSPPLPLVIDHLHHFRDITAEDEEGILLALKHRDRVRRIRFQVQGTVPSLERVIAAIDGGFPMLQCLYIQLVFTSVNWSLPSTLFTPQLRHLRLSELPFPIEYPLPAGLVTLSLEFITPSANFGPNELLQQLSLVPHLKTLTITFDSLLSDQDIERKLLQTPLLTHITLINLRWFMFKGPSTYIKSVLPRIAMPLLKVAEFRLPKPPHFALSISLVLTFVYRAENPRFRDVRVTFDTWRVVVTMYPHEETGMPALRLQDVCRVSAEGLVSTLRRFRAMGPVFSEVELLTLEDKTPFGLHKNSSIRTDWHELLGFFTKVRTLHVARGDLIEELSHYLQPHGDESPIELLPMLGVLSCPKGSHMGESCESFLAARRDAGHAVTISHH